LRSWCDRRLLTPALAIASAGLLARAPLADASPSAAHAKAPARYGTYVHAWHAPDPDKTAPIDDRGRPMLALASLNTGDHLQISATSDGGGFSASDLDRVSFVLREPSTGNEHPIEPRVLDLVYRIQSHFRAQEVRVISGYRTPRRRRGSNHGKGRAIDLVIPGASDEDVARLARGFGFVGIGIYPSSGFVHVDVRDRSYFWVDRSGPGRKNRERGILADVARASDRDALAHGERPLGPPLLATDVDAALRARSVPAEPTDGDDDDDDSGS
jgi:uncharacterized protein YcbK (DUF882 family)